MGLFDGPLIEIQAFLDRMEQRGLARRLCAVPVDGWRCPAPQVVLREESALELGSTSSASLNLVVWREEQPGDRDEIVLVGPDLPQLAARGIAQPLALVVQAWVDLEPDRHYECHRQLREATYRLGLRGMMLRCLPGRQSIWCRIHRRSLSDGLDAAVLGSAICAALHDLPFVTRARVALVTADREVMEQLRPAAALVLDITEALVKMHESAMALDCDSCEYEAVCDAVDDLRRIHTRLVRGDEP